MDNLATTHALVPNALQEHPSPRHQTLSPLSLHQLKVSRADFSLSLLHPRVKENAMTIGCIPVLLLFDMNQLYLKYGLQREQSIR